MREKAGSDMAGAARRPLVAGNWKMNGLSSSQTELARIIQGARELAGLVELMVCPPATLLARFAVAARGTEVRIGAQDCHAEPAGAFTGDLSAEMLKDAGAVAVIVGHSERRTYHRETDADVRAKALAAWRAGVWRWGERRSRLRSPTARPSRISSSLTSRSGRSAPA